jgi:aminoglycoside phosphotransferase (APT) family kinase protein
VRDLGRPEGYVERQIAGWTRRYRDAETDEIRDMDAVAAWLADRKPGPVRAAVVHNDYKYDNLVLDASEPARILGVLDWEMATVGDPLLDLGTALSYWVQADDAPDLRALRFGPTTAPGTLTRRELVDRYAARRGGEPGPPGFGYAFGLFKTAVVAQQIYFRYRKGLTRDARFAAFLDGARALAAQARRAAETPESV